jgi:hypothetical protein
MIKFINRHEELAFLENKWLEKKSNFVVIYGKRRVGKTELIKQFIKNKNAIYFLADKRTTRDQLRELGQLVGEHFNDDLLVKNGFNEWLDVFVYLKKNVKEPFVFAIDEYPYLMETDKATSSVFQKGLDQYLKDSPVMLILSGSSIAMMEDQVLSYKAPLYGRRSGQILVEPLNFRQSWQFFEDKTFKDFIEYFTLTGGMPAYLLEIDPKKSVEDNLKNKILDKKEFLHNEVEFILREELREPRTYLSILKAISWGKTRASEIINETGLEKNVLFKYLGVLEGLKLIVREVPVTEGNKLKSKRGIYKISDNFIRVWFQYVYPYKSNLEIAEYSEAINKFRTGFPVLTCFVYEQVCQEILKENQKDMFSFENVGRWWDNNDEIDVVGINSQSKQILFCEAKWSNKDVGTNILDDLVEKSEKVDWNKGSRKEYFALFSKSGYTDALMKVAKERKDVFLFVENEMILKANL